MLVKRPYIRREWREAAVRDPIRTEVQSHDGRIRHWIWVDALGRYLRVVTLADGQTIHNAFPDRTENRTRPAFLPLGYAPTQRLSDGLAIAIPWHIASI